MTDYLLSRGAHKTAEDGRCAMEWVAYLAGEPHSDSPVCVCPVLKAFCVAFNDGLTDDRRQNLRPFLARTIGTAGDGLAEERAWMATDWLIRIYTPAWLSLAGLDNAAARLRLLPPVLGPEDLSQAMADVRRASAEAAAARDAAGDVARAAARAAAWTAAKTAAGVAAKTAAGVAAGAAGRAAAWTAARAAAWTAAKTAAGVAAGVAAGAAVQPTVEELQRSAFDLLDRMLPTEVIQLPVVADAEAVCGVPICA